MQQPPQTAASRPADQSEPSIEQLQLRLGLTKMGSYIFTKQSEKIAAYIMSYEEYTSGAKDLFANCHRLLFHSQLKHPAAEEEKMGEFENLIQTFEVMQNRGFAFDINKILSHYGTTLASENSKNLFKLFLVYYRNYPEFLYNEASESSKEKILQILDSIIDYAKVDGNLDMWHKASLELLEGIYYMSIINADDFLAKKITLFIKKEECAGLEHSEEGMAAELAELDLSPKSMPGENLTASRPPRMMNRSYAKFFGIRINDDIISASSPFAGPVLEGAASAGVSAGAGAEAGSGEVSNPSASSLTQLRRDSSHL